jgi:hypothetical protein
MVVLSPPEEPGLMPAGVSDTNLFEPSVQQRKLRTNAIAVVESCFAFAC